jgi:homocysteine S-methyltransferase
VLTEGAVIERLRRDSEVELDPYVAHAGFVYEERARAALTKVYRGYLDIGKQYDVPMVALAPTWRANPERLAQAGLGQVQEVNSDCVRYLTGLVGELGGYAGKVLIGGIMGCRGDAYDSSEALPAEQAEAFHHPQAQALAGAGVDFILVSTLPALSEALGMAAAVATAEAALDLPYVLSFVVRPTGTLLDGTPLHQAIEMIDAAVQPWPSAYMINCVHPTVFEQALAHEEQVSDVVVDRVMGLQANTSARSPEELEGLDYLDGEEPSSFADHMLRLHRRFGVKILGGCCGTDDRHIADMARRLVARSSPGSSNDNAQSTRKGLAHEQATDRRDL